MSQWMKRGAAVGAALVLALVSEASGRERPTGRAAALFEAVQAGDVPAVRKLLKQKVDVNARDFPNRFTPLAWAANRGDVELVKVLLAAGADPNVDDGVGQTPLYLSLSAPMLGEARSLEQMLAVMETLCRAGAKADTALNQYAVGMEGLTAAHLAAMNDPRLFQGLVTHCKPNINALDGRRRTPLHSILEPPFSILTYTDAEARAHALPVLEAGAQVETVDASGFTPLMSALLHGHKDTAQLLIDRGASLDRTGPHGMSMLMFAATAGHLPLFQKLLAAGADPKAQVKSKTSVLHFALMVKDPGPEQVQLVQELLARGADPLLANDRGTTPLMLAAATGSQELWELFLERGGDVKGQEKSGATVLMHAAEGDNPDILAQLLDKGLDVRATDSEGNTALHRAARARKFNTLLKLLNAGATPDAQNKRSETPLTLAVACDKPEAIPVARMLLRMGAEPGKSLEDAARCEDLGLYVAMLDAVAERKLLREPPAEVDVLIWGGGKTEEEAQGWLAGFQQLAPKVQDVLRTASSYPQVVASELVEGLKPGFHVVVLGYCGAGDTASRLTLLKALYPGVYAKRVEGPLRANACPTVLFETTRNTTASFTDKAGRTLTVSSFEPQRPNHSRHVRFEAVLLSRTGALLGHQSFSEYKYRGHCAAADYEEELLKDKRGLRLIQRCEDVSAEGERPRTARDVHLFTVTPKGALELKALQEWRAPDL